MMYFHNLQEQTVSLFIAARDRIEQVGRKYLSRRGSKNFLFRSYLKT